MSPKRCAFCDAKLGHKKIAFDSARERLWTICARCGQWNLSVLDDLERELAIAELERAFGSTASRSTGGDVGVAELADGTTLVRVGKGSWSNFASWRYGKRFVHRRDVDTLLLLINVFFAMLPWGDHWLATAVGVTVTVLSIAVAGTLTWAYRPVCRIMLKGGARATMAERHERSARLDVVADTWTLHVRHDRGESLLTGRQAVRVLSILLARENFKGATKLEVATAIEMIERVGGPEKVFVTWFDVLRVDGRLRKLPKTLALALEMAAHEEDERRALEGELAVLSLDMRGAEQVARIVEEELA